MESYEAGSGPHLPPSSPPSPRPMACKRTARQKGYSCCLACLPCLPSPLPLAAKEQRKSRSPAMPTASQPRIKVLSPLPYRPMKCPSAHLHQRSPSFLPFLRSKNVSRCSLVPPSDSHCYTPLARDTLPIPCRYSLSPASTEKSYLIGYRAASLPNGGGFDSRPQLRLFSRHPRVYNDWCTMICCYLIYAFV